MSESRGDRKTYRYLELGSDFTDRLIAMTEDEVAKLLPQQQKPVQPAPSNQAPRDGSIGRLKPVKEAEGPHSTYKRGPDGGVSKHAAYKSNPRNP